MGNMRTIRGEAFEITGTVAVGDGRTQYDLRKVSDGSTWEYVAKGITPNAKLTPVQGTPDTAETVTDGAAYAIIAAQAFNAGDYRAALAAIDAGEKTDPGYMFTATGKPQGWPVLRAAIAKVAGITVLPPTTTRPVAAGKGTRIMHGPAGTMLVGTPFPLRFKVSELLNAKRKNARADALGWSFDKAHKAWILDDSASAPVDMAKVNACVAAMASIDVAVTVDLGGVPAPASAPVASPVKVRKVAPAATVAPATVADPGPAIATALAGTPAHVIAAAVAAARGAAGIATGTPVKVSAPAPVAAPAKPVKVAKAAPVTGVELVAVDEPGRAYALPTGTPVRTVAKALRSALYGSQRGSDNKIEFHVYADRGARTLRVVASVETPAVWDTVDALVAREASAVRVNA